jgi:ribosomal protein S18 acetylase RimI-like enzyme
MAGPDHARSAIAPHLGFQQATGNDVETFLALKRKAPDPKTYGPVGGPEEAIEEITGNALCFIRIGGVIVGMVGYRLRADRSVYISNVAVDPPYRRRGIARAAMKVILEKYESAGRIDLVAHPENEIALRLYMSLGFAIESRQENFFGDGEPRLVLAKKGDHGCG